MRRIPAVTIAALLLLLAAVMTAPVAAAYTATTARSDVAACPAAHAMPVAKAAAVRSQRSLLCLINRERARAGAQPLRADRCLARAASGHARDMVRKRYFEHASRDGRSFDERILATGYSPPGATWTVGENLAWGAAPAGDAAWVMKAWMESAPHRENLLRASFRDIGLAAVHGAPVGGDGPRATWAADFGTHSGSRRGCG